MSEQNKSLVRRFVDEIWNKKNINKLDEFLSPNYSAHNPDGMIHGLNEFRQQYETLTKAFPDCGFTIDQMLAEEDMVSVRYTITGTHRGELRGTPATGKSIRTQAMAQVKILGGKMTEGVIVWDRLALYEQLGVAPESLKQSARKAGGR
jgi:steroid delta-isomerase-like uncharacterized protein